MATFIQGTGQVYGPTPSSPVPIQSVTGLQNVGVCDKNLFDKNNIIEGKYIDSNGNVQTDANSFIGDYIRIDNTKPYYISSSLGNTKRIVYYNASKTFISRELLATTGSTLTIPNNTAYVIISGMNQDLDTLQLEQNTTKTDYESYKGNTYEVNLGKNLFDISTKQTYKWLTYQGVIQDSTDPNIVSGFIKVTPGKQYVFSGIPTTTYTLRVCSYTGTTQNTFKTQLINNQPTTRTFTADADYIVFAIGNSDATILTDIQLEKGSQATSYSPYFTPIELNKIGDYEDSIKKSTGKNLFDIDATTSISGGTKTNNVITSSSYSSGTWKGMDVNFSSIPINQEFTISMDLRLTSSSTGTFSKFNDGTNNFTEISKPTISQNWQRYSYKYTPSSGYSISKIFIQMSAIDGQFECRNIQIEKGSTALPYEPYGKVWYITKNIGKVVFDGSEEWVQVNLGWWTRKNATIIKKSGLALSNKYTYTSSTWQGNYTFSINSSGFTAISDNTYSTLINWQNYLSSNNVEVLHQLETPTTTVITNTTLINQLESLYNAKSKDGTTNISVDGSLPMVLSVSTLKGE